MAARAFAFEANLVRQQPEAVLRLVGLVRDHALREQCRERLACVGRKRQVAGVAHGAGEEARIEEMQDRVLDAADILIDGQPIMRGVEVDGRRGFGRGEAHVVPGAVDERIHRVGFARRGATARRTLHVLPCRMAFERIAGLVERRVVRQRHRQIFFRNRNDAAFFAMDDGDRAAPIALTRDAPVAQAKIDLARALRPAGELLLLEPVRCFFEGGLRGQPIEEARIDHRAVVFDRPCR